ncbi:MAG TPA: complex I NDUFA9 subunit family protein [Geobacterales bacterium]|nr:complex I NDUFA9 subunit family protein [Geobacterales bacterium]
MKVFLSGGSGFVGSHVQRELLARGHRVRLLVHRHGGAKDERVETVEGDVTDAATVAQGMRGCDAAINLVGIIREFPGRGVTFERLHVAATDNMVEGAKAAGINRYLQMSALGSRPDATTAYHRSKYRAEEIVRRSGLEWTIFRPSLIYGNGDAFVSMLAGYMRRLGMVPVIGDGNYRLQPIQAVDVARCFALALEKPESIGGTLELCGPEQLRYNELLDAIAEKLGVRVRKIPNPVMLLRLVVPVLERFSFFPLTSDQMTMLLEENICSSPWPELFGLRPTSFRKGISYLTTPPGPQGL